MKISNLCTRVDLELVQGATFGPVTHTLKNPDGTPVDLTGATLRGQVRRKASDPVVAASFVCTSAAPTTGRYTFELSAASTAALAAGDTLVATASLYEYDIELLDTLGRVLPLLYGSLKVFREVTRV